MPATGEFVSSLGLLRSHGWPLPPHASWRVFPGERRQLRALRRWLAGLLPECPAREDVECVATELGSNAILHTASGQGGCFAAGIVRIAAVVRVAVADGGAPCGPRLISDPFAEHGRGLLVVRGLSAKMGVCGGLRGRLLWADVPWAEPETAKPCLLAAGRHHADGSGPGDVAPQHMRPPVRQGATARLTA